MKKHGTISKEIVNTDSFLSMPLSAQCLYFHLSMHADDEGMVPNAKALLRMLRINEEQLELLKEKSFITKSDDNGNFHVSNWKNHTVVEW